MGREFFVLAQTRMGVKLLTSIDVVIKHSNNSNVLIAQ
jgi:hypothetical protein